MTFHAEKYAKDLWENGFTVIPNVFSKQQCKDFKDRLNGLVERLHGEGKVDLSGDCHNVWNFFRYDNALMPLVFNEPLDKVLKIVIDEDYTVAAVNAINRQRLAPAAGGSSYADNWHTDSRYVGGRRLADGFTYGTIKMIDDFTIENGATLYVPKSHLVRTIPDRQGNYEGKAITGEAGSMVIWDSGLWHKGGMASEKSRWGVFNMYSPWFVKPYWRYPDMIGEKEGAKLSPELRRLFHFDAWPPFDENERIMTLMKNYRTKQ